MIHVYMPKYINAQKSGNWIPFYPGGYCHCSSFCYSVNGNVSVFTFRLLTAISLDKYIPTTFVKAPGNSVHIPWVSQARFPLGQYVQMLA